jgi:hypothetical protein
VVERANLGTRTEKRVPYPSSVRLSAATCPDTDEKKRGIDQARYIRILGELRYGAHKTRQDILLALGLLCPYMQNPGHDHIKTLDHLVLYIKGSLAKGLLFSKKNKDLSRLTAYADANWNDQSSHKSIGGYCVFRTGLISAHCKRQSTIATSTQSAELTEVYNCGRELVWLQDLYKELGQCLNPAVIHEDNQPVVQAIENYGSKTTQLRDTLRTVAKCSEWIEDGIFTLEKVDTNDNIADIFTKPLNEIKFLPFRTFLLGASTSVQAFRLHFYA